MSERLIDFYQFNQDFCVSMKQLAYDSYLQSSDYNNDFTNITTTSLDTIYNNLANVIILMETRKVHDENFYNNSRTLMDDFAKVRQFSSMGQSQTALIENYIGTDKLISRITS